MMRMRKLAKALTIPLGIQSTRGMVSLRGNANISPRFRLRESACVRHVVSEERPPNPLELLSEEEQEHQVERLANWFREHDQILCLTGAGLSTESGIPDYRGSNGSYHRGHKPMVHDQFMNSEYQRKRYWGRGMVGWKSFDQSSPNDGHYATAQLEQWGYIGVDLDDSPDFYENADQDLEWNFSSGHCRLALVTQNVDGLHRRAGSKHLIELHGRTDRLRCMQCGAFRDRNCFHNELESLNREWLEAALQATSKDELRPDGDAAINVEDYSHIRIPPCTRCGGFMKPDVVFFGDIVPKNRVAQVQAAVEHADGLLVVGSSLAVHSAFRHVRAACKNGVSVAILNVGETRAEAEGLDVMKIEAPAGPTLRGVLSQIRQSEEKNLPSVSSLA